MKKYFLSVLFLFLLLIPFASAQENICVYFFHGNGCPGCSAVMPLIDEISERGNIELHKFEIWDNRENLPVLQDYYDAYNIPENERKIPVVFIGNTYLIGPKAISNSLENEISKYTSLGCPSLDIINGKGETGAGSPLKGITLGTYATIIGAAFVDSINPCAIAVLLILLGALLATTERKRAFKAGIAFTVSIYIVYFLFGIGLFSALQISGLSFWFYKVVGIIAILIGLFNIKDYFWYGAGGFVMEVPRSWRSTLQKLLKSVTNPLGAFLMGFVVCLFELPCTGGPYLFVLGLLAEKSTQLAAIPILLLYNLVFILPLIAITLVLYFGYSNVEKAKQWKEKNLRLLHLIAGIIMIVLGVSVVFGLV